MDYISLLLNIPCLVGQTIMHIVFVSRLTGKNAKMRHFVIYILMICGLALLFAYFPASPVVAVSAEVLVLYAVSRFALDNRRSISLLAAVIAIYVTQISFGIINSVQAVCFPALIGSLILYPILFLTALAAFVICACCYSAVRRLLPLSPEYQTPYIELLLFPGMFLFAAELYILRTSYSSISVNLIPEEIGRHVALLLLQVMGLAALLCTLYAYRHLCQGFQAQAALQSLTQAAQAQKVYITEAQARYEQTKSFRHDIKNHLSVLDGLLKSGNWDESREYLKKLETASESLSFPYQTGNPVVDILLGEKLGLAEEIAAEVSLLLPRSCGIDDFDLCVIFANALDNAIAACRASGGAQAIHISGKQQGDFYMLTFENTCTEEPLPPAGTGLSNIKAVAEKYHGAVLTEKDGRQFYLSVLLNIVSLDS